VVNSVTSWAERMVYSPPDADWRCSVGTCERSLRADRKSRLFTRATAIFDRSTDIRGRQIRCQSLVVLKPNLVEFINEPLSIRIRWWFVPREAVRSLGAQRVVIPKGGPSPRPMDLARTPATSKRSCISNSLRRPQCR
jgi:hypothetical protein